ncbi:unnamed protein product [Bursaphelenchus xylophilus]|uniref:L-dopachrome isomerase n=1 Tax=Bursaphelenchus xylophilus TaxID=6326 RepID=A0A1I7S5K6_BURXY|nr:unnamed protein product [Bursaphelenchus xylophilus]CAG9124812.1 unnamed protein product [Bursaphelenchus xylophilus]
MPVLEIRTNLKKEQVPNGFLLKAAETIAQVTDKPIERVACHVQTDQLMSFGGSESPCGSVTIRSIGNVKDRLDKLAKELTDLIVKELVIPSDRFYILFQELGVDDVAHKGLTVRELRKQNPQ